MHCKLFEQFSQTQHSVVWCLLCFVFSECCTRARAHTPYKANIVGVMVLVHVNKHENEGEYVNWIEIYWSRVC